MLTLKTCDNGHSRENYETSFSDSQATFDIICRGRLAANGLPSLADSDIYSSCSTSQIMSFCYFQSSTSVKGKYNIFNVCV